MYSFEDGVIAPAPCGGRHRIGGACCPQHGLLSQGAQKLWYAGPMFRYERPQAEQRQFHQIGVEWLGAERARSDVEVIALAWDLLAPRRGWLAAGVEQPCSAEDRQAYRTAWWLGSSSAQKLSIPIPRRGSAPIRCAFWIPKTRTPGRCWQMHPPLRMPCLMPAVNVSKRCSEV